MAAPQPGSPDCGAAVFLHFKRRLIRHDVGIVPYGAAPFTPVPSKAGIISSVALSGNW